MAYRVVYIKRNSDEEARQIPGESVEEDPARDQLIVKDRSGAVVGKFPRDQVESWWIQEQQ
jgi:uncharacterized protein (UPF0248 family)